MKTLQANNYSQALKELEALDSGLKGEIKETINEADKDYFHVALIRVTEKVGAVKNDVSIVVQHYNLLAFEKLNKNFMYQNISKLIVVHDPRENTQEASTTTAPPTEGKTEAEIEAEIEKRVAERMKESAGTTTAPPTTATMTDGTSGIVDEGKEKPNLAELKLFAKENEIDLKGLTKKDDIEKAIEAWKEEQEQGEEQE